jgi:hypothetical protein
MSMNVIARALILLGVVFLVIGGMLYLLPRFHLWPGRLPGDFQLRSGNFTCILGLGTSILFSILLTLVVNLMIRFLNR